MRIRPVSENDRARWRRMRCTLLPGHDSDHAEEIDCFFRGTLEEPEAVLVAEEASGVVGFVDLSIRPTAEGCHSRQVGFLEAWYVNVQARRRGIGRALVAAAEDWARDQGCTEPASDAQFDNEVSTLAHLASGFEEVGLIRCFRKAL